MIGGLSVGGAGRTPVVEFLAERAQALGIDVAIVGHGYRGRIRHPQRVDAPDARRYGDEAAALFRRLSDVPLWVGPDRAATIAAMPAHALILIDGGLLDAHLPRRRAVLVVDATASTAVMPAGPLRAPLDRVNADVVWRHRCDEGPPGPGAVRSAVRLIAIEAADGTRHPPEWLAGRAVRVLCGIARPRSFCRLLTRHGAHIVAQRIRPDHHWFSRRDQADLDATWIVTTKDRARLAPHAPVLTAITSLTIEAGDPDAILRATCAG